MTEREELLNRLTKLMSDTMGKETGRLFYKFYELEDEDEMIDGARSVLHGFIGPDLTEKKLKEAKKR